MSCPNNAPDGNASQSGESVSEQQQSPAVPRQCPFCTATFQVRLNASTAFKKHFQDIHSTNVQLMQSLDPVSAATQQQLNLFGYWLCERCHQLTATIRSSCSGCQHHGAAVAVWLTSHKQLTSALNATGPVAVTQLPPPPPNFMQVPNPRTQQDIFAHQDPVVKSAEIMVQYADQTKARLQEITSAKVKNTAAIADRKTKRDSVDRCYAETKAKHDEIAEEDAANYSQKMEQYASEVQNIDAAERQNAAEEERILAKAARDYREQRSNLEHTLQNKRKKLQKLEDEPNKKDLVAQRKLGTQAAGLRDEIQVAEDALRQVDEAFKDIVPAAPEPAQQSVLPWPLSYFEKVTKRPRTEGPNSSGS